NKTALLSYFRFSGRIFFEAQAAYAKKSQRSARKLQAAGVPSKFRTFIDCNTKRNNPLGQQTCILAFEAQCGANARGPFMNFSSDNWAGAHPAISEALAAQATGFAAAYGQSELDRRVERRFNEIFEREVAVFFVATGTAAN